MATLTSKTTNRVATMRFLRISANGFRPPPANAITMADSLDAAAKTPMKTRSRAFRREPKSAGTLFGEVGDLSGTAPAPVVVVLVNGVSVSVAVVTYCGAS